MAILERAESWHESAQQQLAEVALEIQEDLKGGYHATPEELKAVDRSIAAADRGEFATEQDVESVLAKFPNG
jgi:hypothetical protein